MAHVQFLKGEDANQQPCTVRETKQRRCQVRVEVVAGFAISTPEDVRLLSIARDTGAGCHARCPRVVSTKLPIDPADGKEQSHVKCGCHNKPMSDRRQVLSTYISSVLQFVDHNSSHPGPTLQIPLQRTPQHLLSTSLPRITTET